MSGDTVSANAVSAAKFCRAPVPNFRLTHSFPILVPTDCLPEEWVQTITDFPHALWPSGERTTDMLLMHLRCAFPEWREKSVTGVLLQCVAWCVRVRANFQESHLCDFLEFFAGRAQLTAGMVAEGFKCKAFDTEYALRAEAKHDVLTPEGFRYWTMSVLFTKPGADQWHGIVCKS